MENNSIKLFFNQIGSYGFSWAWLLTCTILAVLMGIIWIIPLLIVPAILIISKPSSALNFLLITTVFQNLIISFMSDQIIEKSDFTALQGLSFGVLMMMSAIAFIKLWQAPNKTSQAKLNLNILSVVLMGAFLYFCYGILTAGFNNALIYFRTIGNGVLYMVIGIYLAQYCHPKQIYQSLFLLAILLLFYAIIELFFTFQLYTFINYEGFYFLKGIGQGVVLQEMIQSLSRSFFNTPWLDDLGLESYRLLGPNLHTISFAYIVAIGTLIFAGNRHIFLVCFSMIILFIIGAKGPFIMAFFAVSMLMLQKVSKLSVHAEIRIISLLILSYITAALIAGIIARDYHVLGFLGGLKGFLTNPIGHGFGVGGNLTSVSGENIFWQDFQSDGRAAFGLESSIGVMLYQWGILTFLWVGFLVKSWHKNLLKLSENPEILIFKPILVAFPVLLANLFFQEEAMSPLALGVMALILGYLLGISSQKKQILIHKKPVNPAGDNSTQN